MGRRPIYYDTETTGLSAQNERIVEIACYDPVEGREFCTFVNPGRPIPPEATAIHHITDEMVQEAPTFKEVAEQMVEFCTGECVLTAHNNDGFDIHFLREEFKRNEVEMPKWEFFDTLKWARKYRRDLPRHSLQFLREIYGIAANNAHRALDDVIMLHQVFSLMIDDLNFDQVFELMQGEGAKTGPVTTMPFGKHQGKERDEVPASYIKWLSKEGALDKPDNEELKKALQKKDLLPV